MPDYHALQKDAKKDVETALDVWSDILQHRIDIKVQYAYAKGSSVKPWDSPVDYVPVISDLDIHIRTEDGNLFPEDESFKQAMRMSEEFESQFLGNRPKYLHIPRNQIILMGKLEQLDNYTPPRKQDVRTLFGAYQEPPLPPAARIRAIDRTNLLNEEAYLQEMPMMVLDKTGLDYWNVIRKMNWRVSPAPIRLLNQTSDNPIETWAWNRSRIIDELEAQNHHELANLYTRFYMSSWTLFLSKFSDLQAFREVVRSGYYLLQRCIQEMKHPS